MKTDRDKLHLLHIRDSVDRIMEYANNINYNEFAQKDKIYDAILMRIVVIGEAANNLSENFQEKYHNLPLYEARGTRNRIAHGYIDIDPKVIWEIIKNDLPKLKKQIENILKDYK